jgi:SAM-dependent methyltransferase
VKDIKKVIKERYSAYALSSECCSTAESSCCQEQHADSSRRASDASETPWPASTPLGCGIPLRYAGLHTGDTVLDLGSGPGIEALAAAEAVGPEGRVIGVDVTPEMVAAARSRAHSHNVRNAEFLLADIEALPLKEESVDVAISNCVINLAPNKRRVFAEVFRVLKPGGRFSISDMVSRGQIPVSVRKNPELWAGCIGGAIDEEEYLDIIRETGFRDVEVHDRYESASVKRDGYSLVSVTVEAVKPKVL